MQPPDHALPTAAPELDLLLWAVRPAPEAAGDDERLAAIVRRGIDWPLLREAARNHRLEAALRRRLQQAGPGLVPDQVLAGIRERHRAQAATALRLTAELLRVSEILTRAEVRSLFFKGPVLAQEAYGSVHERQFIDIDLLVARGEVGPALEALAAHGYLPYDRLSAAQRRVQLRTDIEVALALPGGFGDLDLHWELLRRYRRQTLDTASVFARARTIRLDQHPVRTLARDDLLLYLCGHGAVHLWSTLGPVLDLSRIISGGGSESPTDGVPRAATGAHPEILSRAREMGLRRTLLLGLGLARDVTGIVLPEWAEAAVSREPGLRSLQERVEARLLSLEPSPEGLARDLDALQLGLRDTVWDRTRYGFARVFSPTPEELQMVRLPGPLAPLHFVIRPFYALGRLWRRRSRR